MSLQFLPEKQADTEKRHFHECLSLFLLPEKRSDDARSHSRDYTI